MFRPIKETAGTLAFLLITSLFFLYTYNSGYGYDASEYLMIGRALLHGFPLSAFVLSKGWAIYAMTAAALAVMPAENHTWISLLITILFALAVGGTWWTGNRLFGPVAAAASALLVAACGFFMEMNFLEPEIPVYLCGLLGVYALAISRPRHPAMRYLSAGLWIGLGFAFKSVALFYLAGVFFHLLLGPEGSIRERGLRVTGVALGFGIAIAAPACYFAATGQLRHHIEWSLLFPLLHYPANTWWLSKLYTKLLWFFLLLFGAGLLAATRPLRQALFADPRLRLMLMMGLASLLSLLKSQPSHYVFPGAAFLSFFIAQTFCCWWSLRPRKSLPLWAPVSAAVLLAASAYLYRPAVFARFLQIRDFEGEDRLGAQLRQLAPPDDRVLFLRGGKTLYWIADRYPNVPLVDTDVQPTYLLFQQPEMLSNALDDPQLKLVEFDPQHLDFDDPDFLHSEHHRNLVRRFSEKLQDRFTPVHDPEIPLSLWIPKLRSGVSDAR